MKRCRSRRADAPGTLAAHVAALTAVKPRGSGRQRLAAAAVVLVAIAGLAIAASLLARPDRPIGVRVETTQVVTWPSRETEGRVLPDGAVSFLSDRGGAWNVWLAAGGSAEPARITDERDDILSHVWSPDGSELAYILTAADGVHLRIATRDATPVADIGLPQSTVRPKLVRWTRGSIYVLRGGDLWAIDPVGGDSRRVLDLPGFIVGADVRASDGRIIYVAGSGQFTDLWTVDPAEATPSGSRRTRISKPRLAGSATVRPRSFPRAPAISPFGSSATTAGMRVRSV